MINADFSEIEQELGVWNRRRRLQALLVWGPRGFMAGLSVGLILALISRFRPFMTNREVGFTAVISAAIGLLAGILFALMRRHTLRDQAIYADRQFGLRERVTTALELHEGELDAPADIRRDQLEDTLKQVKQVDVQQSIPLTFDTQELAFLAAAIALLIAAVILPNAQSTILQGERAVEQVVAEQIERLETLEEQINENAELSEEQREELLAPINEARETLEGGVDSREEALATLSEAESELRELAQQNSTESLEGRLAEAGSNIQSPAGEGLSDAMGEGDLERTADELENLSESVDSLTAEEQQALGSELSQAASELQDSDPELAEQLAEAGSALQQGDTEAAGEALAEAGETAEARAEAGETAEVAEQAASELTEGRQEVAASEQEQQPGEEGQPSEPQAGEGSQPQEGTGGQPQPGGGAEPSEGSGIGQPAPGTGGNQPGQSGGGTEGGGSTDNVFVPPFRDLSGFEGVEVELDADCDASPENCGELLNTTPSEIGEEQSVVPYEEVYAEYANTAYETLAEDYIPIGMKGYIRDYFSSLEPETE